MTVVQDKGSAGPIESGAHWAARVAIAAVAILFAVGLIFVLEYYLDYWVHRLKDPAATVFNLLALAAILFIRPLRNLAIAFLRVFALTLPFLAPLIALALILPHYLPRETADGITIAAMFADTILMFWVLCFAHRRNSRKPMGRVRSAAHRWSNLMPVTHYFFSRDGSELRLILRFLSRRKQEPPNKPGGS